MSRSAAADLGAIKSRKDPRVFPYEDAAARARATPAAIDITKMTPMMSSMASSPFPPGVSPGCLILV